MNQQRDLEGISALVTGASSGIGKAAAEELGRHGAEVVVHGRDTARGSAVADTITAAGGKARFVAADLTDPAQLDDLVDQAGTTQDPCRHPFRLGLHVVLPGPLRTPAQPTLLMKGNTNHGE